MYMKFKKIDNEELSVKVYRLLLGMLKDGSFDGQNKFPPETVLPVQIGVSRSVVRDALGLLESDGFITRKRGVGTVINWDVVHTNHRIDLRMNLFNMVQEQGFTPTAKILRGEEVDMNGVSTFRLDKIIYADKEPVIYIEDTMPVHLIDLPFFKENEDDPSITIYDLMLAKNVMVPEFHLLTIDAIGSQDLDVSDVYRRPDKIYFKVCEKGYNIQQEIILDSRLFYRADFFTLTLLKRNIYHPY